MPAEATTNATRNRPRSRSAASVTASAMGPTEEQVRQRAYEIYIARGARPGNPEWDWQQAELELRARLALLGKP